MKKVYVAPMMELEMIEEELPLCGSVGSSGGGVDVGGLGGVDEEGLLDPAANFRLDFEEEQDKLLW